jgi:hypothetical protein
VNAVRAAVPVAPGPDAVVVVAAVFLLDAVALEPQAETPTAAASATSVTSAALDKRFADLMVSVSPFILKTACFSAAAKERADR